MKIELYDVVRTKDGRKLTILEIHGDDEAYEVIDENDDVYSVDRDQIEAVTWVNRDHKVTYG